jgi:hypothetical protein
MMVARRWISLGSFTRNRNAAPRLDKGGTGIVRGDRGIDIRCVTGAVAGERCDRPGDLIEQRPDPRSLIDVVPYQFRGDDLTGVSIQADVQLPPGPARPGTMLLHLPLPRTRKLQAAVVHDLVHPVRSGTRLRVRHVQPVRSTRQGGMVLHREIEAQQADDQAGRTVNRPDCSWKVSV